MAHVRVGLVLLVVGKGAGAVVLRWRAALTKGVVVRGTRVPMVLPTDALVVDPPAAQARVVVMRTTSVHQLSYFAVFVAYVVR